MTPAWRRPGPGLARAWEPRLGPRLRPSPAGRRQEWVDLVDLASARPRALARPAPLATAQALQTARATAVRAWAVKAMLVRAPRAPMAAVWALATACPSPIRCGGPSPGASGLPSCCWVWPWCFAWCWGWGWPGYGARNWCGNPVGGRPRRAWSRRSRFQVPLASPSRPSLSRPRRRRCSPPCKPHRCRRLNSPRRGGGLGWGLPNA